MDSSVATTTESLTMDSTVSSQHLISETEQIAHELNHPITTSTAENIVYGGMEFGLQDNKESEMTTTTVQEGVQVHNDGSNVVLVSEQDGGEILWQTPGIAQQPQGQQQQQHVQQIVEDFTVDVSIADDTFVVDTAEQYVTSQQADVVNSTTGDQLQVTYATANDNPVEAAEAADAPSSQQDVQMMVENVIEPQHQVVSEHDIAVASETTNPIEVDASVQHFVEAESHEIIHQEEYVIQDETAAVKSEEELATSMDSENIQQHTSNDELLINHAETAADSNIVKDNNSLTIINEHDQNVESVQDVEMTEHADLSHVVEAQPPVMQESLNDKPLDDQQQQHFIEPDNSTLTTEQVEPNVQENNVEYQINDDVADLPKTNDNDMEINQPELIESVADSSQETSALGETQVEEPSLSLDQEPAVSGNVATEANVNSAADEATSAGQFLESDQQPTEDSQQADASEIIEISEVGPNEEPMVQEVTEDLEYTVVDADETSATNEDSEEQTILILKADNVETLTVETHVDHTADANADKTGPQYVDEEIYIEHVVEESEDADESLEARILQQHGGEMEDDGSRASRQQELSIEQTELMDTPEMTSEETDLYLEEEEEEDAVAKSPAKQKQNDNNSEKPKKPRGRKPKGELPLHVLGRYLSKPAESDGVSTNGSRNLPKPRLGVKIPCRNLTSQIVSKAELQKEIIDRFKSKQDQNPSPDILFARKLTQRLAKKIIPEEQQSGAAPAAVKSTSSAPNAKSVASAKSAAEPIENDSDLIAILEGNDEDDLSLNALSSVKSTGAAKPGKAPLLIMDRETEKEIARQQLNELPLSDTGNTTVPQTPTNQNRIFKSRGPRPLNQQQSSENSSTKSAVPSSSSLSSAQAQKPATPKSVSSPSKTVPKDTQKQPATPIKSTYIYSDDTPSPVKTPQKVPGSSEKKPFSSASTTADIEPKLKPEMVMKTYTRKRRSFEMDSVLPMKKSLLKEAPRSAEIPSSTNRQNAYVTKSSRIIKKKVIWDPAETPTRPRIRSPKFSGSSSTSGNESSSSPARTTQKSVQSGAENAAADRVAKAKQPQQNSDPDQRILSGGKSADSSEAPVVISRAEKEKSSHKTIKPNLEKKLHDVPKVAGNKASPGIKKVSPGKKLKQRLTEVDKLLMDEGAVNMLYEVKNNNNNHQDDARPDKIAKRKNKDVISLDRAEKELRNKANSVKNDLLQQQTVDEESTTPPQKSLRKKEFYSPPPPPPPPPPASVTSAVGTTATGTGVVGSKREPTLAAASSPNITQRKKAKDMLLHGAAHHTNSPPASPAYTPAAPAEASRIIRRHSSSSFSSDVEEDNSHISGVATTNDNSSESGSTIRTTRKRNSNAGMEPPAKKKARRSAVAVETKHQQPQGQQQEQQQQQHAKNAKNNNNAASTTANKSSAESLAKDSLTHKTFALTKRDRLVSIELNYTNPKCFLTEEALKELTVCLKQLAKDNDCHVISITSRAKDTFCRGLDYKTLVSTDPELCKKKSTELAALIKDFLQSLLNFPKVLVAGIQGDCVGLGVTMLPLFDMVVASDTSTFSTPYAGLGCVPEAGFLLTVPYLSRHGLASELLYTSQVLKADDAFRRGLVTRLCWPEKYHEELKSIVTGIASQSRQSIEGTKHQLRQHLLKSTESLLSSTSKILVEHWTSPECQESFSKYKVEND